MPPVPAGVMLDVNEDAMRERNAGANGTGSATEPTNETAANKYVSALPASTRIIQLQSASPERVHGVADVRELREQEVERRSQRDDRQQRARPDAFEPFERAPPAFPSVAAPPRAASSSGTSPSARRRRIGRGNASGCRNGRAAATRSAPRPSTAASTAASTPTSKEVSTSSWATSRARCRGRRGELGVVEIDEVRLVVGVDDDVLQRQVAVRDAAAVEGGDLEPELIEERPVDARGLDLVRRSPDTSR